MLFFWLISQRIHSDVHSFQAYMHLHDYDQAATDFKAVLDIEPQNKIARNDLVGVVKKISNMKEREKQAYAGMFDKFAESDTKVWFRYPSSAAYPAAIILATSWKCTIYYVNVLLSDSKYDRIKLDVPDSRNIFIWLDILQLGYIP